MKKGWEKKKLREVCSVFEDGDWIESKDQSFDGIRLIQTGNIGNGFFKDREAKARYISESTFKKLRCTEILENDCLISRLPDPVGRACILPKIKDRTITAVDCTIIRFQPKILLPNWFIYYSLSKEYQIQIDSQISGATRQRISRNNLGLIAIPLPPLPEQQRIVSILDEAFAAIDKAIANAEQNLKNAKALFASYFQGVFSNINSRWERKRLSDIATFRNGMNFTKGSKGESIKIVGVGDFKQNFWVPLENLDSVTIDGDLREIDHLIKGDILTVRSNGNPELIGRCILTGTVEGKVSHSGFTIRIRLNSSKYFPEYLCVYLKSETAKRQLIDGGTGINIKSLNQETLSSLIIPVPPFNEQQNIVKKLDTLSIETKKLEALYEQKLADLEELKKSILQKAFSGKLDIKQIAIPA